MRTKFLAREARGAWKEAAAMVGTLKTTLFRGPSMEAAAKVGFLKTKLFHSWRQNSLFELWVTNPHTLFSGYF